MAHERHGKKLNQERSSIQAGWSPAEKEIRRLVAGNKQRQLKQLLFLTAIASQQIRRPAGTRTLTV